jgi:putative zinc finger/helix-turn-helix YgiT family protein
MKCTECGKTLKVNRPNVYRYRESGLESVMLTGVRVYVCPGCGGEFPEIPNVIALHHLIAQRLVRKPSPLTGSEFRFLRKELGIKAKELAHRLGITDVSLSRWETGTVPINPAADRLLRVFHSLKAMQAGRAIEPTRFISAFLDDLRQIAATTKPQPLDLRIPVSSLVPHTV